MEHRVGPKIRRGRAFGPCGEKIWIFLILWLLSHQGESNKAHYGIVQKLFSSLRF